MSAARDLAVTAAGDGRWDAEIRPGWDIAGNANGGYLLSLVGRALVAATERPDPVTVTGHYLSPGRPGPVAIETEIVRSGRTFTTARADLDSTDRRLLTVLGTFGDLAAAHGPERVDGAPPDLPPPDDCLRLGLEVGSPPFMSQIDVRLHPDDAGFRDGAPTGEPLVRGWFRLLDEAVTTCGLLLAVDAFPPTAFNARLPMAWTPTLELTAHVRARPAPGWLRCRFMTRFVSGGFLEEDGEIWDEEGRLVAQSRQLALTPLG
jgi:acyl-coenzyme A thioesterase PaaI-like protein